MKYLSDYTNKATTKALNESGAFFAFSKAQFDEQKKYDVKYVNAGYGMVCPKENVDSLFTALADITARGIQLDLEENGKDAIILRELNNHEAFYIGDLKSTVDALSGYGFTNEDITAVYKRSKAKMNATYNLATICA